MKELDKQSSKSIKVILPGVCPHCSKKILTSIISYTPTISWILKESDATDAKNKVIDRVNSSNLPLVEKKQAMEWIESGDIIIGPDDVEPILKQIIK